MSTTQKHWAHLYIGKPWESGGRGPDRFDCWGLLWWVKRTHFGIEVPEYPGVDAENLAVCAGLIDCGTRCGDWEPLLLPIDGCAVGLSRNRRFHHVGVYAELDGGLVVHAHDRGNVVAQSVSSLRNAGYRRIEFYQYRHGPRH